MKNQFPLLILLTTLGATSLFAADANLTAIGDPAIGFYVGLSSFPKGDSIEITSVEQSQDRMVVKGHYNLVSADSAELSLYTTTSTAISVPTDPTQLKRIFKGEGDFELTDPHLVPGLKHVSMYSLPGGRPFAGVYFGTKDEATAESKMDLGYYHDETAASSTSPGSLSGPNHALFEYLGNPIEPPANLDTRYTATGLVAAIQTAARNAGITVKQVTVDESEFPFLVGVICTGSDYTKLKEQIRKLDGYEYNGSIGNDANSNGSDTCNAFSMVPYGAYPSGASQQIYHRLGLRQQVFYDKMNQH